MNYKKIFETLEQAFINSGFTVTYSNLSQSDNRAGSVFIFPDEKSLVIRNGLSYEQRARLLTALYTEKEYGTVKQMAFHVTQQGLEKRDRPKSLANILLKLISATIETPTANEREVA